MSLIPQAKNIFKVILLGIFLSGGMFQSLPVFAAEDAYQILGEIPVQQGGRVKPFQTFAREALLFVTGRYQAEHKSATEIVWQWMIQPEKWQQHPFMKVDFPVLHEEFSKMMVRDRVSPEVILGHKPFLDAARIAYDKKKAKEKLTQEEQKRIDLYEKAAFFQHISEGGEPGFLAHGGDASAAWLPWQVFKGEEGRNLLSQFLTPENTQALFSSVDALKTELLQDPNSESARQAALDFKQALEVIFESKGVLLDRHLLRQEIIYNHLAPFHYAWQLYLLAVLFWILALLFGRKNSHGNKKNLGYLFFAGLGILAFAAGFALHGYGFYLRCIISGRPPVTNMYESIIWVSWAAVLFALILVLFYRQIVLPLYAALIGALCLIVAQGFPVLFDPFISPLVPVLRSNLWLTVHVLTITLSYGAFALAWGLGHGAIYSFVFSPNKTEFQDAMVLFLYRTLQIGVVLLAAGTVLGGVWANYSWGRFWGWDPKETWALIALLGYLMVLHGRFAGWLTPYSFAVSSVVAFLGILMAWYGVNYVLAAGLHSYGFGGGGAPYVMAVILLDFIILFALSLIRKKRLGV